MSNALRSNKYLVRLGLGKRKKMTSAVHHEKLNLGTIQICQGHIGFVWSDAGLHGFELPDSDSTLVLGRLTRRFPQARPAELTKSIAAIARKVEAHLSADLQDWSFVELVFLGLSDFRTKVYQRVRQVPAGTTVSYSEVAELVGSPGAARAVGMAMRSNPLPLFIPCHRVVAAGSKPGGFTAPGGLETKLRMLKSEGVLIHY